MCDHKEALVEKSECGLITILCKCSYPLAEIGVLCSCKDKAKDFVGWNGISYGEALKLLWLLV